MLLGILLIIMYVIPAGLRQVTEVFAPGATLQTPAKDGRTVTCINVQGMLNHSPVSSTHVTALPQ